MHRLRARLLGIILLWSGLVFLLSLAILARYAPLGAGGQFLEGLLALLLVAGAGAALYGALVRHVDAPLRALLAGVKRMEAGERTVQLTPTREDEIGELTLAFNRMSTRLHQKDEELARRSEEMQGLTERAEAASQAKSQFLANMSHELRTPLNIVMGYTQLLKRQAENEGLAEFLEDVTIVGEAGTHLLALVNTLIDLSRIEAGKLELHPERFEVTALLEPLVAAIQPLLEPNRNRLVVQWGGDLGKMESDPTRLREILFNLLGNAAKFTEAGQVTLRVSRSAPGPEGWLLFAVQDTGPGIAPERLPALFDEFSRGAALSRRRHEGAGLGLAISRRLALLLGGTLTVASQAGVGTTFALRLPATLSSSEERDIRSP